MSTSSVSIVTSFLGSLVSRVERREKLKEIKRDRDGIAIISMQKRLRDGKRMQMN
jgi:hypothetical protein